MPFLSKIKSLAASATEILFPPICLVCGKLIKEDNVIPAPSPVIARPEVEAIQKNGLPRLSTVDRQARNDKKNMKPGYLCIPCQSKIIISNTFTCPICHGRIAPNRRSDADSNADSTQIVFPKQRALCHPETKYLLAAASNYDNATVKALIWQLKYKNHAAAIAALTPILKNFLERLNFDTFGGDQTKLIEAEKEAPLSVNPERSRRIDFSKFIITPLPLHKSRLRERGYNQSELLAEVVAKILNLPMRSDLLIKTKKTKPQVELKNWDERKDNLQNCFSVTNPDLIEGKNIILVDDVTTSGTTLAEVATVLKTAGARKIIALVIARAG